MGNWADVGEPAVVAAILIFGTLINFRRPSRIWCKCRTRPRSRSRSRSSSYSDDSDDNFSPVRGEEVVQSICGHGSRRNLPSRLLNMFPFLVEIWYWLLTYWLYQLARAYSAYVISGNERIFKSAESHALLVMRFESWLHIDIEHAIQGFFMQKFPFGMTVLENIYKVHIAIGVAFLVYIYTYVPTHTFQHIRRTVAIDNWISFVIFTLYRCSPPRLLPKEYGFIDVLHSTPQSVWDNNRFQLTIAAMPSLHFGTSALIGFSLYQFAHHRFLRVLAPFYPIAMFLAIVATANHFVLDAMVGVCIPIIGWRINRVLLYLLPIDRFIFSILRLDKPPEGRDAQYNSFEKDPPREYQDRILPAE